MKNSFKKALFLLPALFALAACGGGGAGGGSSGGGGGSSNSTPVAIQTLSGTAATGIAYDGSINVYGANGGSVLNVPVDASGNYVADVTGLTPPYLILGIPSVTSTQAPLTSWAAGPGTANIDPLTTLTLFLANGEQDPAQLATTWPTNAGNISTNLPNSKAVVNANLAGLFSAINAALNIDFITYDVFSAPFSIGSIYDQILDLISVDISSGTLVMLVDSASFPFDPTIDTSNINIGGTTQPINALVGTWEATSFTVNGGPNQVNASNTSFNKITATSFNVNETGVFCDVRPSPCNEKGTATATATTLTLVDDATGTPEVLNYFLSGSTLTLSITIGADAVVVVLQRVNPIVTLGGTISGLTGSFVLQNNGGNNLSRSANGAFTFAGNVTLGTGYDVTVLTHPAGQTCTVSGGNGTVTANVTNIVVNCSGGGPALSITSNDNNLADTCSYDVTVNGVTENWKRRTMSKLSNGEQVSQWHNTVTGQVLYETLGNNAQSISQLIHWGFKTPQSFTPGYQHIKLPLQVGTTWTGTSVVNGTDTGGTPYTTDIGLAGEGLAIESITTPAGTFSTIKVVINEVLTPLGGSAGSGTSTAWVASSKCTFVRIEYTNSFGDSWTLVLTDTTDSNPPPIANLDPVVGTQCKYRLTFTRPGSTAIDEQWVNKTLTSAGGSSTASFTKVSDGTVVNDVLNTQNTRWSQTINIDGTQLSATPSYEFMKLPLSPGVTWGRPIVMTGATFIINLTNSGTAIGWETRTVSAGSFLALKTSTDEDSTPVGGGVQNLGHFFTWFTPASLCRLVDFSYSDGFGQNGTRELIEQL